MIVYCVCWIDDEDGYTSLLKVFKSRKSAEEYIYKHDYYLNQIILEEEVQE